MAFVIVFSKARKALFDHRIHKPFLDFHNVDCKFIASGDVAAAVRRQTEINLKSSANLRWQLQEKFVATGVSRRTGINRKNL